MSRQVDTVQDEKKLHRFRFCFLMGAVLLLLMSMAVFLIGNRIYQHSMYLDAIKEADVCYSQREYLKAVEYYEEAAGYSDSMDEQQILNFAASYMEAGFLEDAAELLQRHGDQHPSIRERQLSDEIVERLMNQQFEEHISRGKRYETSEDYVRAVKEYLDAYRIRSSDVRTLRKVVSMYLKSGNTSQAKEFLNRAGTSEEVSKLKHLVEGTAKKQKYDALLDEAKELFCGENYRECIETYDKAILLLPGRTEAYRDMVDSYIKLQQYDTAIERISQYEEKYQYESLERLKDQVQVEKNLQEDLTRVLGQIYKAFAANDTNKILEIVHSEEYQSLVNPEKIYYYSYWEQKRVEKIPEKKGLIVYGSGCIYCGDIDNGQRNGTGKYFGLAENALGYFLYQGCWGDDLPNGEGILYTEMSLPFQTSGEEFMVEVHGTFRAGLENGHMRRKLYRGSEYFGVVEYRSISGIPQPMDLDRITYGWMSQNPYNIGIIYARKKEFPLQYLIEQGPWGVPQL